MSSKTFQCEQCSATFTVVTAKRFQQVPCPNCGERVVVAKQTHRPSDSPVRHRRSSTY